MNNEMKQNAGNAGKHLYEASAKVRVEAVPAVAAIGVGCAISAIWDTIRD